MLHDVSVSALSTFQEKFVPSWSSPFVCLQSWVQSIAFHACNLTDMTSLLCPSERVKATSVTIFLETWEGKERQTNRRTHGPKTQSCWLWPMTEGTHPRNSSRMHGQWEPIFLFSFVKCSFEHFHGLSFRNRTLWCQNLETVVLCVFTIISQKHWSCKRRLHIHFLRPKWFCPPFPIKPTTRFQKRIQCNAVYTN